MTDRLSKTVLLGSLSSRDLFGSKPERLRVKCENAFEDARAETLTQQQRAGLTPPGEPRAALEPFTGRMYDEAGHPTPEYLASWQDFYRHGDGVHRAQQAARMQIHGYDFTITR